MASKVSTLVNCSNADEVECLNDFVESIQNEMSVNGAIPFTIPAESIAQLVQGPCFIKCMRMHPKRCS